MAATGAAERLEPVEVRRGVDRLQLGAGRGSGIHPDHRLVQTGGRQPVEHRPQAGRSLGVARARVVVTEARMGGEEDGGHGSDASGASPSAVSRIRGRAGPTAPERRGCFPYPRPG